MTLHDAATRRNKARAELRQAQGILNREIVKAYKNGESLTRIADEAGVSRQHVHNVLRSQR